MGCGGEGIGRRYREVEVVSYGEQSVWLPVNEWDDQCLVSF
jgi:hypothetical protein